jgi:hypothetical protein
MLDIVKAGVVYEHLISTDDTCDPDGNLYFVLGFARDHRTDEHKVVYIPLYYKTEWGTSPRMSLRSVDDFREHFRVAQLEAYNELQ